MRITNFLDKMILAEICDCIWADRLCGTNSQGFKGKMLDTIRKKPRKILRLPKIPENRTKFLILQFPPVIAV
jgi:hypothetical protein